MIQLYHAVLSYLHNNEQDEMCIDKYFEADNDNDAIKSMFRIIDCTDGIKVRRNGKNDHYNNTELVHIFLSKEDFDCVDEKGHTTKQGVFSCGDVVTGAKTVVHAVSHAKIVADSIIEYCEKN